jgi:hypothetical protein
MAVCVPKSCKWSKPSGCGVALVPTAVGVASVGCEAERSQAANSKTAATANEIMIIIFLVMLSSSGTALSKYSE